MPTKKTVDVSDDTLSIMVMYFTGTGFSNGFFRKKTFSGAHGGHHGQRV